MTGAASGIGHATAAMFAGMGEVVYGLDICSSVAGRVPQPYTTAYSAAKGGLTMLTRALALELSPDGIRVNAICPGTVDTPIVSEVFEKLTDDLDTRVADRLMMMLSGTVAPSEIAAGIRYLSSPDAKFVTGAVLAVDGGMG